MNSITNSSGKHTVEKIGGTSMSRFNEVMTNILVGNRHGNELYNRIFVVSAYGGVTDALLEHKKSGKAGVFSLYSNSESEWSWSDMLSEVCYRMCSINAQMFPDHFTCQIADQFVKDRVEGVRSCLIDLQRICSYGHFQVEDQLATVREMLSAIGEAHSAHNTTLLLQQHDVNATFVDLTGWREIENPTFEERIQQSFAKVDVEKELPIVTGYTRCREGLMKTFDRGYSEITFSKIAIVTGAAEAIIHKEYHLSSADPKIVGEDKVMPIGRTNYDVSDQLANLGMEAIHPSAAKGLRQQGIPLRVKNTFEPEHAGTLIDSEYKSQTPGVEIIAGRKHVFAVEFHEQDMIGAIRYDKQLLDILDRFRVNFIGKDVNANTITHYLDASLKSVKRVCSTLEEIFPSANILTHRVSIVSVIGSDMKIPGILHKAVGALTDKSINILAMHQTMRQVEMEFIIDQENYERAIISLHRCLIEGSSSLPVNPRLSPVSSPEEDISCALQS
ncbi:MAG TPA: aspartate kinase [Gammaproteobacteria bacterium]